MHVKGSFRDSLHSSPKMNSDWPYNSDMVNIHNSYIVRIKVTLGYVIIKLLNETYFKHKNEIYILSYI